DVCSSDLDISVCIIALPLSLCHTHPVTYVFIHYRSKTIIQSPQDFAGLFCDSCVLKFLISRELFQKVAMKVVVFLGVCCDKIAGASESCDKKSRKFPSLLLNYLFFNK